MPLNNHEAPILSTELVKLISNADYFAANCEAPIVDMPINHLTTSFTTFVMPLVYLEKIFDQLSIKRENCILSVANNHSRDEVKSIFNNGVRLAQKKLGLNFLGQYLPEAPPAKIFHSKNGLNFGMTSWTHLMNGEAFLNKDIVVTRQHDIEQTDWINFKNTKQLDFLIGMPHWDQEYQHFPQKKTFQQAKNFTSLGFDMLIGSHSHVLQPLTWFNNKLCCFSLGNFCSTDRHWRTKLIPIFEVEVTSAGNIAAYQLHIFMQIEDKSHIYIEPLHRTPLKLQNKVKQLLTTLFK